MSVNKRNKVARIIYIIGWVIFFVGFITGLIIGKQTVPDFEYGVKSVFVWSVVIPYWFTSFIVGMLFIGLAEIIELLEVNKLYSKAQLQKLYALNGEIFEEQVEDLSLINKEAHNDAVILPTKFEVSDYHKESIRDEYKKRKKNIQEIISIPFEDFALVKLEHGDYDLVELRGFTPEIIPKEKWSEEIKKWFDENFK